MSARTHAIVKDSKEICCLGIVNDEVVIIFAYYDTADRNKDGKINISERIFGAVAGLAKNDRDAIIEVAVEAKYNMADVDASFGYWVRAMELGRSAKTAMTGAYVSYFARNPRQVLQKAISNSLSPVRTYVVKPGREKIARDNFRFEAQ